MATSIRKVGFGANFVDVQRLSTEVGTAEAAIVTLQPGTTVNAAATDAQETEDLVNQLRLIMIATGAAAV